jgi:hypothetical protein
LRSKGEEDGGQGQGGFLEREHRDIETVVSVALREPFQRKLMEKKGRQKEPVL